MSNAPPNNPPPSKSPSDNAASSNATPRELIIALRGMIGNDVLRLELDLERLNHMDSPVAMEADSNMWVYGGVALAIAAGFAGGLWSGAASAVAALILYFTAGKAYVRRRLRNRVYEAALSNSENWMRLWRFGGLTLITPDGRRCAAPQGNWMELVRNLSPGV